ncbi:MAG: EAL domain-containing protein [Pseudomonadota bacterium]|nr:EAL domain-containing protein [Pseudomonadota bacterium]
MDAPDAMDDEAARLRAKQVDVLFDQSPVALAASAAAAIFLVGMFWGASPQPILLGWFGLSVLVTVVRIGLIRRYRGSSDGPERARHWLRWFVAGVILSGAIWGVSVILLVPVESLVHVGFAVLWVCGLSAGAVAALAVVKGAFFAFSVPALTPGILYLLMQGEALAATIGGAQLIFLVFISLNALRMHKTLVHGLQMQLRNAQLIAHLDAERARVERLNAQLEERVAGRTAELAAANDYLQQDIADRRRVEQALFAEKERAQVTLHSIGDAVITTNAEGIVEYLNPVAETLTGWSVPEASDQPLSAVFHIVDEHNREPVPDPVAQCFAQEPGTSPPDPSILISRSGREYAIQNSVAPIRNRDGEVLGVVLVFNDVTEARRMAREMSHQATHDVLTGLVNRREFEHRLRRILKTSRKENVEHALCYLDLDQFKVINDTCGHTAGDEFLRQLGQSLQRQVRERDTLARLGGDEFGALLEHCPLQQARRVADALRQAVEDFRFFWEGKGFRVGVSIGLVPITQVSENLTAVLRAADSACYAAKEMGRNRIHLYHEDDAGLTRPRGEMQTVTQIIRALEDDRFHLLFQPLVPINDHVHEGTHYELLLRMSDEHGRVALPGTFLPTAERYNLSTKLDHWVTSKAFEWLADHPDHLQQLSLCAINLSGLSLGNEEFLDFVAKTFKENRVLPQKICFEVTETAAIANLSGATRFLKALKSYGCQFALDDFGSGMSSFSYLKNLPVDYLKIDGVFVKDIVDDPIDLAMVKSIHEIGRAMGKLTIAEYVENKAILGKLQEIGIDYAQGYYIGRPQPIEELT